MEVSINVRLPQTDADGRIVTHYIYLYGKPVAKIDITPNPSWMHRLWRSLVPGAGADSGDSVARVYAIHTDHLGTPQTVTDDAGAPVWQAHTDPFGKADIRYTGNGAAPFEMNLRLPGQVYDAETGLNQNYYRDYDPQTGRYTTPDPIGMAGGLNPYAYVSSNPLNKIDPQGLYESDIHYYMTFSLALAASIDQPTARRIALATQYVDNNPLTTPMPQGLSEQSMLNNHDALLDYHFVMPGGSGANTFGQSSDQLERLYNASATAQQAGKENACWQFLGEYLHAFEDTYAHRDPNNISFDPIRQVNIIKFLFINYHENEELGLGHGLYMHDPDYTYDHDGKVLGEWSDANGGTVQIYAWPKKVEWKVNQDRTLAMEKAVFQKLSSYGDKTKAKTLEQVEQAFAGFNAIHENEDEDEGAFLKKTAFLTDALAKLNITGVDFKNGDLYDPVQGGINRDAALKGLNQSDYPGTLLPKKQEK